jgi:hypothetical protein
MAKIGTKTGTKLYYGDLGTDPATQLEGVREWGDMPGGEDIEEYETTELDAVDDGGDPEWIKTHEPGHEDPGHLNITFTDDGDLEETLNELKRVHKAFKIVFVSGAYQLIKDAWIKGIKRVADADGDWKLAVRIRINSRPEFHAA